MLHFCVHDNCDTADSIHKKERLCCQRFFFDAKNSNLEKAARQITKRELVEAGSLLMGQKNIDDDLMYEK